MTNRRRIIDTLLCKPVDRPPFPMWLGFAPWGEALERWRAESGIADLDVTRYFGFEPFCVGVQVEYGPFPHFEQKVLDENDKFVTAVDWRGIVMRNRKDGCSMPEFVRHPIGGPGDWKRYKEERLQPRLDERLARLGETLEEAKTVDAHVQAGTFPWGVFGTARDLLGAEELLLAFYDYPEMVRDIMETNVSLWISLYEKIQEKIQIDHIHIWEDMSGRQGSLISMDMVKDFMMPCYDRVAEFARAHGVPLISVDSDGRVDELVEVMHPHGVNAFFPFEVQAGCDVELVRSKYPKLGIMGGLDKNALARGKPEINRELDRAERMFARGGYIAGFDHLIPENVPWENYKYFVEHLKRIIGL